MEARILKPSSKYVGKQILIFSMIAIGIIIVTSILGMIISMDGGSGGIFAGVFLGIAVLFWIVSVSLTGPYYRSLRYEIHDDEIIVHVGIITKSVKHVPFRTVTNIKINRGLLDRFVFNLGTLNIQTAGMSGSTGAEESLVGLADVQEIYEAVAVKLRKFRGGMSPTGAEDEVVTAPASGTSGDTFEKILGEVEAIRRALEERR